MSFLRLSLLAALTAGVLPLAASAQEADVSPRWRSGQPYDFTVEMDNTQTMTVSMMGDTHEIPMRMAMMTSYTARPARRDDGGWTLALTLDRSRSSTTGGAPGAAPTTVVLDTADPDAIPAEHRDALMRLVGQTTVLTFGPDFAPGAPVWPDGTDASESPLSSFDLPRGVHRVGESWTTTSVQPSAGLALAVRTTYTLDRVAADSLHLSTLSTFTGEGDVVPPGSPEGATTHLALSGTGHGTMAVHRANGGNVSTGTTAIGGTMTMRDPRVSEPMEMQVRLTSRTTTHLRPR